MTISQQYHALYTLSKCAYVQAAKRANMEHLPPYKFPRKKPENSAAASFNRQMAGSGIGQSSICGRVRVLPQANIHPSLVLEGTRMMDSNDRSISCRKYGACLNSTRLLLASNATSSCSPRVPPANLIAISLPLYLQFPTIHFS